MILDRTDSAVMMKFALYRSTMGWTYSYMLFLLVLSQHCMLNEVVAVCKKSFPSGTVTPDSELMMALYLADPDPTSGYMLFLLSNSRFSDSAEIPNYAGRRNFRVDDDNDINYSFNSILTNYWGYNKWLAREHDAGQSIINLWLYLVRLVVSDIYNLHAHYRESKRLGNSKPKGVIKFQTISARFREACNSLPDKWPYSCFNSVFFCKLRSAISQIVSVASMSQRMRLGTYSGRILLYTTGRWPMHNISYLGIDAYDRGYALSLLFNEEILKFIPDAVQDTAFYESRLVLQTLEQLAKGKDSFQSWANDFRFVAVKETMNSKCDSSSTQALHTKFYCVAKNFIQRAEYCATLNDTTPCLFERIFQKYFYQGGFTTTDALHVINTIASKTQTVVTAVKNNVINNNNAALEKQLTKYSTYLLPFTDSTCRPDWPKAFDCQHNTGCDSYHRDLKFDCAGGYTCRTKTLYRFDCIIKFVLGSAQRLMDLYKQYYRWTNLAVQRAKYDLLIWLSYPPISSYSNLSPADINDVILSTQQIISTYVTSFDINGLDTFMEHLPSATLVPFWLKTGVCQTADIKHEHMVFCALDPVINSVAMFLDAYHNSRESTAKSLSPTIDYRILIDQLQLDRVQGYINLQTENYFNDLTKDLQQNFGTLSNYFTSLADYDRKRANADIAYITSRIDLFNSTLGLLSDEVTHMLAVVLKFAIGANVAELQQRAVEVAVAMASAANPLAYLLGGSNIVDLIAAANALAQAGVQTAIIAYIGNNALPDLNAKARRLREGFSRNSKQYETAKNLIYGLQAGRDSMQDAATAFLEKYNEYDPIVLRSDITIYGERLQDVGEQLCEAAFAGGTAVAALVEIGLASSGECSKLGSAVAGLVTLYEEIYDFQFDLMDALADAARAHLAHEKAHELKLIYTSGPRVDQAFLQRRAVNTYMVSTMNVWNILVGYCDVLTYTGGGVVPDKCTTALINPSHLAVAQVLAYSPGPICNINNEDTAFFDIPTKSDNDEAYIDLEKLYNREIVTFKIPNFQWLKDKGWFGSQDSEKVMYIKRFEIYLPPMSGSSKHTVEVTVNPSLTTYLKPGGTKYFLPLSGYRTNYMENSFNCYYKNIANPYTLCTSKSLTSLCIKSEGYVDRRIQPSIYTEWKITASIPVNQPTPKPVTNFKLQVGITMCKATASARNKRDASNPVRKRRGTQHCCLSNQYWDGKVCTICPTGSSQRLEGYYCS